MSTTIDKMRTPRATAVSGDYWRQFAVIVATLGTIAVNGLATGLPLNGQTLWADVPSAQAWRMGLHSQPHLAIDLPADRLRVFSPSAKEL